MRFCIASFRNVTASVAQVVPMRTSTLWRYLSRKVRIGSTRVARHAEVRAQQKLVDHAEGFVTSQRTGDIPRIGDPLMPLPAS